MRKIKITSICSLFLFIISFGLFASNIDSIQTSVLNNYKLQAEAFPQEKIHLHIDKPSYLSGERIWFRAHLVSAITHSPFNISKYVYVELVDTDKTIISRVKVRKEEAYSGYIDISEEIPEGKYFLRAYTLFMKNTDNQHNSYTPISINDPNITKINIRPSFEYLSKNKVRVTIKITNIETKDKFIPTFLKISHCNNDINYHNDRDGNYTCNIKLDKKQKDHSLFIQCDRYRKRIIIPPFISDFDITFFPEGGNLIADSENTVAFKAIDNNGNAIEVEGKIIDENGTEIQKFKTVHEGMGSFPLKVQKNKKYFATTSFRDINKQYELPSPMSTVGMKVSQKNSNLTIQLLGYKNIDKDEALYIVAHTRGFLHFVEKYNKKANKLELETKTLPSGILHLLVINDRKETLSERLVFCMNDDLTNVKRENTGERFGTRKQIPIRLSLSEIGGEIAEADNISVSVVDRKDVDPNVNPSILSTLLLSSDLKGYIANPNYYFEEEDQSRKQALDLVMLTHGWRRYNIPDVIKGRIEDPLYPIEIGQVISGKAKSLIRGKPITNSLISIISPNTGYTNTTTTDENGSFTFQGFEYADSARYIVKALTEKGSDRIELILDIDSFPNISSFPPIDPQLSGSWDTSENLINYINKAEQKYTLENGMRMINLRPIEVKGRRSVIQYPTPYSIVADKRYTQEDIKERDATSLEELLWSTHGTNVTDTDLHFTRAYGRPAAIYVDGVYIFREGDDMFLEGGMLSDQRIDYTQGLIRGKLDDIVNFDAIESVEVFKPMMARSIFGSRGMNGVVSINTKKGDAKVKDREVYNIKQIYPLGYQIPAEFYAPKYETAEEKSSPDPDLRTTIYWNPKLKTDKTGRVNFDFYSADSSGTYTMTVEGVTNEGQIIRYQDDITIK